MPWKNYNPKIAMPKQYKDLSDWGTVIPTSDEMAWTVNPKYRWVYNKLELALSQGIPAAPLGVEPTEYPVIVKPITNLSGGGIGAFVCHTHEQYKKCKDIAGYFWSRYHFGTHYSIDLIVVNGDIKLDITFVGEKLQLGLFDYWYLTKANQNTLHIIQEWICKNIPTYTGCLNLEVLDNVIIEAHLRFGDLDRLGDTELLESIHALYNGNKWVYNNTLPKEFYIAALFGQREIDFNINPALASYLFSDLTYFQLDSSGIEPMGCPILGKRIALFCDSDFDKVTRARNIAIALTTPDIDGRFTDPLTNYTFLKS
jgi:hypothetical protein